jgi:predicted ribosomally synthesized peptide with SipW-like signal peptide
MTTERRIVLSVGVVALLAAVIGMSWAAFSSTTGSPNNVFAAGTVNLGDNDAGSYMYNVSNQKPGDTVTRCIKVTYTGSLAATVKVYASAVGTLGTYVDLTVTTGTGNPTFPDCSGFTADSGPALYTGTLKGFADTYNNYDTGLVDNPGATASSWATNDSVVYRLTLTLQDNNLANGGATPLSTGLHSFTWEARNQ